MTERRPRVLVVDDEPAVRDALRRALRMHGFEVALAADGLEAIAAVTRSTPDVIVLDVMMPGVDGFGVLRRLRQDAVGTPILMLTARDAVDDRVTGLELGADDYLVKPFALEELVARLRALLRRTDPGHDPRIRVADLVIDPDAHTARRGERTLELSPTEFALLCTLAEAAGRVLTREHLLEVVWGGQTVTPNTLEVYISALRRELGEPRLIHTVRGVGYTLRAPDGAER